ncbi:UDP-N-acetylmuramoyl-tripeptide--D-alanyl-D-alanine ligase [Granulicatella seriolae]|uniref:UDP-N-acetylmuramoyl-tripeptide--D-alanyl-D-alanine ligase n=1 Tax=Granulicatella seriolae TaxID=2967226 RepID=A0ABT1WNS9_9LACT|nr:UDP-N-acetylmuramoyl-tripeptide--D-alanyl-D-alanine ligase [Granulicatella seriolae]
MTIASITEVVKAVKAIDYQSAQRFETITNVAFDARKIQAGGLFVPLKGNLDGHDFAQQALDNGAVAVLWSRTDIQAPDGLCTIWVDDTLQAFQDLAKWYLNKVKPTVIGITGSSGKTTTKDMTAAVLATTYKVYKTQGNYNNEIGLPQTILDMPADTEKLVLEMGMSEFGEIAFLSKLAKPSIAVISMIGESHIENLGSRQGIAKAKLEILSGLENGGTIIYPNNEPLLTLGVEQATNPENLHEISFGTDKSADLYVTSSQVFADHSDFTLAQAPELTFTIPVLGDYNIQNALAAIAVGQVCQIPFAEMARGLADFQLTANRTQWVPGMKGSQILNDAYNASPTAMKAVLQAFSQVDLEEGGRRIAVLGDIRELGIHSAELHASIADAIDPAAIDQVYLYGPEMQALYNPLEATFPTQQLHYFAENMDDLTQTLKTAIQSQDKILIKSSNGTGLLTLVDALKAD